MEQCPIVEVSLKTCYHHIFTFISKLFWHYILLPHGSAFGTRVYYVSLDFYVSMGFMASMFIWFLVDCMFLYVFSRLSCSCIKFMFQYPCLFLYRIGLSSKGDVLVDCLLCILKFILCYMFLCLYASIIPSTQKTFIQKLNCIFVGFYVLCILFLTCITFSLVLRSWVF
jgi:hypothetical protein